MIHLPCGWRAKLMAKFSHKRLLQKWYYFTRLQTRGFA